MPGKLDSAQRREICRLRREGTEAAEIAERYGVSAGTVYRVLRTAGEPERDGAESASAGMMTVRAGARHGTEEQNLRARMLACRGKVYQVMDLYLDALLDLERFGKVSPNQLTGALSTLVDLWGKLESQAEEAQDAGGVIVLAEVE